MIKYILYCNNERDFDLNFFKYLCKNLLFKAKKLDNCPMWGLSTFSPIASNGRYFFKVYLQPRGSFLFKIQLYHRFKSETCVVD
jgi:hypothetical protein